MMFFHMRNPFQGAIYNSVIFVSPQCSSVSVLYVLVTQSATKDTRRTTEIKINICTGLKKTL